MISTASEPLSVAERISETAVNYFIRVWRIARTTKGADGLSYPTVNILHPEFGIGSPGNILSQAIHDAERVQSIVEKMPKETRSAFEAYHLGVIRGDSCRDMDHKARWIILAISKSTYFRRVKKGRDFVHDGLDRLTL